MTAANEAVGDNLPAAVAEAAKHRHWSEARVFQAAFATVLAAGLVNFAAGSIDDAYITFRYAQNFVHGHGLCFNIGELIEGYTSFGQILLMAPATLFGKPAVGVWATLLGIAAWAGVVALTWRRLAREYGDRRLESPEFFVVVYLSVCTPGVVWAWSQMEPALLTFVWVAAWTVHLSEYETNRWPWRSALLTFAAGLLHPEGILVGLPLGVSWLWPWREDKVRRGVLYGAIGGGLFAAYWIWRWNYFGDFLPNTFYVKVGGHFPWRAGLSYVARSTYSGMIPLSLAYLLLVEQKHIRRWPRWLVVGLGIVAALVFYNILVGGDYFAFQRFLLPGYPFVVLATWRLWRDRRGEPAAIGPRPLWRRPFLRATAGAVALAVWAALVPNLHVVEQFFFRRAVPPCADAGRMFRRDAPRDALVATIPIGAFGYFSEARILDMMGLTDKHIARLDVPTGLGAAGHEKYDYEYIFSRRPDIIIQLPLLYPGDEGGLRQWLRESTITVQQYAMYDQPELRAEYVLCWHWVKHRTRSFLQPFAAEGEVGVFAYLRQDHLDEPAYRKWTRFAPELAALPFVDGPRYIADNQRRFAHMSLGNFVFTADPVKR